MSWQPTDTAEQDWPRITPLVKTLIAINVVIAFLGASIVPPSALEFIE